MAPRGVLTHPRAVGGGRSPRYEKRPHRRSGARAYAPEWSDASAAAVLNALKQMSDGPRKLSQLCDTWLMDKEGHPRFIAGLKLSPADAGLTAAILDFHRLKAEAAAASDLQGLRPVVKAFLKPLRERMAARAQVKELRVPAAAEGPQSFHVWLSPRPGSDRHRDIKKSQRIIKGIRKWPLGWMKTKGVVCFERANGRINRERGGNPDSAFMRGIVKCRELATLTANPSDQYVVLTPGKEPRFMTVEETLRAFGVPPQSLLWKALTARKGGPSPGDATRFLGRSVHTGVARQIVKKLASEGLIAPGMTYGSAFSGIDTFAAAVEAEMGEHWTYEFASEYDEAPRRSLLRAWGPRGLKEEACFKDARDDFAACAERVDLYVTTPECTAHSRRNHAPSAKDQRTSLEEFWASLAYVRRKHPRVVIVENVHEPSSVGPMTGLLSRIPGYEIESGELTPQAVAKMPIARDRHFWVLKSTVDDPEECQLVDETNEVGAAV